jgi:hypothetical protein
MIAHKGVADVTRFEFVSVSIQNERGKGIFTSDVAAGLEIIPFLQAGLKCRVKVCNFEYKIAHSIAIVGKGYNSFRSFPDIRNWLLL